MIHSKTTWPTTLALCGIALCTTAIGCGTTATGGGAYYATDGGGGTSGGGTSGGDSTKNTASVGATDDKGAKTDVKVDKAADKKDVEGQSTKLGATNAGKVLNLFIADASGTIINVFVDTEQHQLPAKGIKLGGANSDAWVSYSTVAGGVPAILESKDTGTLDIDSCPEKEGTAVVGRFNGVIVVAADGASAGGPKSVTLDGPFNLVYWGGAGALSCKPKADPVDAGSTSGADAGGGGGSIGDFAKPAGATCDYNACEGGANMTRQCCKYIPCIQPCFVKCADEAEKCAGACGADSSCAFGCLGKIGACIDACFTSCEVDAACKQKFNDVQQCMSSAEDEKCPDSLGEDKQDACAYDACCAQIKAGF